MPVQELRSGARLLAAFERIATEGPVSVTDLAQITGDDPSALQRVVVTLANAGWIERSTDPGWRATDRVRSLLGGATPLTERARPVLELLRDEVRETAVLAGPDRGRIVIVDVAQSTELLRTAPSVGTVVATATSAFGQAFLSALPTSELGAYIDEIDDVLLRRLALVHRRGWSIRLRATHPDEAALGSPILDAQGRPVAAIGISAPASRMPVRRYRAIAGHLTAAARSLSAAAFPGNGSSVRTGTMP